MWWPLRSAAGATLVCAGLVAVAAWGWAHGGDHTKLTHFFINVTIVVALQAFSGNSGILSFGHMALFGTGAYVAVYRMDFEGWSNEQAITELRGLGYVTLDEDRNVFEFLSSYQAVPSSVNLAAWPKSR